ncbi:DUF1398 family protein [Fulvivirgaceae bacterium PWU5]|uniref:DUF1398 family protein n=1 Tax=Dawidia cretensis TaxID=2782350 RepID=A0AAP2DZN1_9BACT|nr:DUF1398 family protein [Dawidia cretensis]MBT1710331.1 DUF1398 family protein [Dawidia cretensis]
MFTLEQIRAAHAKVKSGADFPQYFENLKAFGLAWYETLIADGHTVYHGTDGYETTAPARYTAQVIADVIDPQQFEADLRAHQQGKTDFPTFCTQCAALGVNKWIVRMDLRTCTYYDRHDNVVLTEEIPGANR